MTFIKINDRNELVMVNGITYHNSIPTTMFDYCKMKLLMIILGTTQEELDIFEGQFYGTRELTGIRD